MQEIKTDLLVIGGGSGGLSIAAGAVQMGARVVLVEQHKMGGDCLNYGCVPSKSLLAAAHSAATKGSKGLGVELTADVNFEKIKKHIRSVINTIAPHDSVERFSGLGVKVITATAKFTSPYNVQLSNKINVRAKFFVIASGSKPSIPPIDGLDTVPYLTNENIFNCPTLPKHLLVIGGGPIGLEIGQAFKRLGSKVSIVDMFNILPHDNQDHVNVLRQQLLSDKINLIENARISNVLQLNKLIKLNLINAQGKQEQISASHILIAAGRRANLAALNLDQANVKVQNGKIEVNKSLRSVSNKRVYAVGDVVGKFQFTHMASYHAGIVIRNVLFKQPAKVDYRAVPWVTYTDPEVAHVGLSLKEAVTLYGEKKIRKLSMGFDNNDRAQTERCTLGNITVIVTNKGKILGVDIIGKNAGELVHIWTLAIQNKLKISAMASFIAPYPTLGEINKRVAGSYFTERLFSPSVKRLVKLLLAFNGYKK